MTSRLEVQGPLTSFTQPFKMKNAFLTAPLFYHIGDYHDDIVTQLAAHKQSTDEIHVQQSLFGCGKHGQITFREYCKKGCVGGDKKDDYCS